MTKKNRKSKNLENMEVESAPADAEMTGAVPAEPQDESTAFDPNSQEALDPSSPDDSATSPTQENEIAAEDLLDDVRRSLIEEETDKSKKESKWWRRIGKRNKSVEPQPSQESTEIDLPAALMQTDMVQDQKQEAVSVENVEQIDDLINLLATEQQESRAESAPIVPEVEIAPEPEPEIDFEKLKERAFQPRTADEPESNSDVRSIALEGGEEVFVEVQSQVADPFEERIRGFENALKPYRSYIYLTLAFLGVGMAVIASLLIFNVYQQSRPEPVKEVSNLPYPVGVSLPGGWTFQLAQGSLQAGKWEPQGPEWLEGTEVCRWVSLPWSRQLEAVVRTLNPKDPIELVMSNNDKLEYLVYSVREMSLEEIQQVDSNSPCLLIILAQSESEKRWVLTALP